MYKAGFNEGTSTATHNPRLFTQIHLGQGKKKKSYAALINLHNAFDTEDSKKLWRILCSRLKNETNQTLALLIIKMYKASQAIIGRHSFSPNLGVVQEGVILPMLINV